jgi:non-canonical poly(A) RNA polymerase PAPD5/7
VVGDASAKPWELRKMRTTKGRWLPSKAEVSIPKNKASNAANAKALVKQHNELLTDTRGAFEKSKDYKGVVVKPMIHKRPIKESALPWCLEGEESAVSGNSRYISTRICRLVVLC